MADRNATPHIPDKPGRFRPSLALSVGEKRAILAVVDLVVVNGALLVAAHYTQGVPYSLGTVRRHLSWFIALSLIWALSALATDCYDLKRASQVYSGLFCTLRALVATCLAYIFVPYVVPSRFLVLYFALFAAAPLAIWRLAYAGVFGRRRFRRRALVIGAGWAGRTIARAVRDNLDSDYELIGYIDDDPGKQGQVIEGLPVLGTRDDLARLVEETRPDETIFAITHNVHEDLLRAVVGSYERGVKLSAMPLLYEQITGRVPVEHMGQNWHVALPAGDVPGGRVMEVVKRLVDVLLSLVGLALLALVLPFFALAIRLDSPGPVFQAEECMGKGGRSFRCFRFRLQPAGRFGRFLWALHLEKLPRLWNILRGEMSFVGPRPELVEVAAALEEQIPFYRARHAVRPGLTGWAQVSYKYGEAVEDEVTRLSYDLYYIKHGSLYLDLLILLKSFGVVLALRRA